MPTGKASAKKKKSSPVSLSPKPAGRSKPLSKSARKPSVKTLPLKKGKVAVVKASPKKIVKPAKKAVAPVKAMTKSAPAITKKSVFVPKTSAIPEVSAAPAVPIQSVAAKQAETVPVKKSTPARVETEPEAKLREKKYAELFGISLPKGKGLNLLGEPLKANELAAQNWSVMQFPPRTGRLSWIYATHGLSTVCANDQHKPTRVELVMHWRERGLAPIRVLTEAANYLLQSGRTLVPGDVLAEAEGLHADPNELMLKHFLVLNPEPFTPSTLDLPGGDVKPLMLLGISDAELESATKVRPELADGKLVLMNALRAGGVFPVTDPKRQCLTRRRDFLRIWEAAFRGVRERKV